METKYQLIRNLSTTQLQIDKDRFELIIKYKSQLLQALYIEEKYDIFISNYLVIEKFILDNIIDRTFYNKNIYTNSHEFRLSLNRMFINVLSSIKMYQDQIPSHVKKILLDIPNAINKCKSLFSIQYDSFFEYQFMDALRNHTQHGGEAVHKFSFRANHLGKEDFSRNEFSMLILSLKSSLKENSGFKSSVLNKADENTDLIRYARKYIQCLNTCHIQIREMISDVVQIARNEIESTLSEFENIESNNKGGNTYLVKTDKDGNEVGERISLFLEYDNERLSLINKNRKLSNLHMACFASTNYPS